MEINNGGKWGKGSKYLTVVFGASLNILRGKEKLH